MDFACFDQVWSEWDFTRDSRNIKFSIVERKGGVRTECGELNDVYGLSRVCLRRKRGALSRIRNSNIAR